MLTVYLETTIPSYLAAKPSRDLVTAAHQQITHEWWTTAKERFQLVISEAVHIEISAGDPSYSDIRLEYVADLPILAMNDDVKELILEYDKRLGLAGSGTADLPHFAFAVAYNVDYLVTWNCRHIANGQVIRRLASINADINRPTPIIVTPEELLTSLPDGDSQ